jgi:tripartite-type tricarboxylate transporter receptor subunit TctC
MQEQEGFMITKILAGLCVGIIGLAALPSQAADAIEDFYKGKQMRMISGSTPGGGYDLYARTVAQYLPKYIPGHPTFVVQNMPGAGSVTAINNVAVTMPQDGTVIVAPQAGAIFSAILGNPATQFDAGKMNWIGSLNEEPSYAVTWHTAKVKTFDDLLKYESIFGTSGANTTEQFSSMLIHLFDAKIKQVPGYESVTRSYPAMERGEIEGLTTLAASIGVTVPHFVKDNLINVLVVFNKNKLADFPKAPTVYEFLNAKYVSKNYTPEEATAIMDFMLGQQTVARPYGMGQGVPPERVAAIRKAMSAMVKDKDFLADAEKARRDISFVDGDTMQKIIIDAGKTPKATLDKIDIVTKPKQGR